MKKIIAATLALTLSMSMGNLVYAVEDKSANIKATYQAGKENTDTVYSVDVKWGNLEYTYSSGVTKSWDPTTLKYKETSGTSSWTCQQGADQITVTNNSNADITASLTYAGKDSNITGTFTNSKIGLKSAEGTTAGAGPSETTTLSLTGALSDTTAVKKEIGNVTVTISDYVGTSSNYKWDGNGSISWGFLNTTLTDGVYTVEKECPGDNYSASIFYIYNRENRQEQYVIKDGTIKAEGTYSLQKVNGGNGSYGVSLPSTMALKGKTIRLTVDLRDENNPTLIVKVI